MRMTLRKRKGWFWLDDLGRCGVIRFDWDIIIYRVPHSSFFLLFLISIMPIPLFLQQGFRGCLISGSGTVPSRISLSSVRDDRRCSISTTNVSEYKFSIENQCTLRSFLGTSLNCITCQRRAKKKRTRVSTKSLHPGAIRVASSGACHAVTEFFRITNTLNSMLARYDATRNYMNTRRGAFGVQGRSYAAFPPHVAA